VFKKIALNEEWDVGFMKWPIEVGLDGMIYQRTKFHEDRHVCSGDIKVLPQQFERL
jgi:hypothetical protein